MALTFARLALCEATSYKTGVTLQLERAHDYALKVGASEFEALLAKRDDVLVLGGSPRRPSAEERAAAKYFAWRTGADSFLLTTGGEPINYGELDPPALTFRFRKDDAGSLVRVEGQQHLGGWDGVRQNSMRVMQGSVFLATRVRLWFSITVLAVITGVLAQSAAPAGALSWAVVMAFVATSQFLFARWHLANGYVDPARTAWQSEHDALTRVVGEVLTPQLRGSAADQGYRALAEGSNLTT